MYQFLKELRDETKRWEEEMSLSASNTARLFLDTPQLSLSDEPAGVIDDRDYASTRLINDGSRTVCLLREDGEATILDKEISRRIITKKEVRFNILSASVTIPAKSVKLLGELIVRGLIPQEPYIDVVRMKKMGDAWVPVDMSGKGIKEIKYINTKGWCHE